MPYSASVIAYAFVKKGIENSLPITQMKLQKVVYFAHGVYMALNNEEPLIREEFEAWQFGPVVSNIYQQYRMFGNNPIINLESCYQNRLAERELKSEFEKLKDDRDAIEAINYTWESTKNLSAYTLSNWTHLNGSPWAKAYTPGYAHIAIDNSSIASFFKQLLNKVPDARPAEEA